MHIEKSTKKNFEPIKIVLDIKEEALHLLYILCYEKCPSDPQGIQTRMRELIFKELNRQDVDLSTYARDQGKLREEYIKGEL